MSTKFYREITEARRLLELPESATMERIKSNYRSLLAKWHPDKCEEDKHKAEEMTRRIVAAYRLISDYCASYRYSFSEQTVREHLPPEDWWMDRFGDDPHWGGKQK
ncbi:MAG: J domain-containing protein [Desulfatibacillaceae bacterium]